MASISKELRAQVISEAQQCCEYCQTQQRLIGMPLVIDHIMPRSLGGNDNRENLAASCYRCNTFKAAKIQAIDPMTQQSTSLFNPRQHTWNENFAWSKQATYIEGLTSMGRATVNALQLNNPYIVESRKIWVTEDWHPPDLFP